MVWKKCPSWLKGGLIGIIFILIDLVIFLAFEDVPILSNISFVFLSPVWLLFFGFNGGSELYIAITIILTVVYFFIGAIIGWLIGKFKK